MLRWCMFCWVPHALLVVITLLLLAPSWQYCSSSSAVRGGHEPHRHPENTGYLVLARYLGFDVPEQPEKGEKYWLASAPNARRPTRASSLG